MNKLTTERRTAVVAALVEGNSIRATVRMTGVAKNTVAKLLVDLGAACATYHDQHVRDVKARRVQVDEVWSFCYAKEKNVPEPLRGTFGYGDVWTWTAIEADTKLVVSYLVGLRDAGYATEFIRDVASRISNRIQLTSDGHIPYLEAVRDGFGEKIDYAMLRKLYGIEPGLTPAEKRYSPMKCVAAIPTRISGNPDPRYVSTSYAERQNLTMRMSMRRFTRLTNGFSKKIVNHECAVALYFMHYNFCRIHQTLRITPAMAAGLTDHLWEITDLLALLDGEGSN